MNTRRINRIAKARGGAAGRAHPSRIRGPSHGCQGSAGSQKKYGGNSTQILRRTDLSALNRKGELAQLQAEVVALPDIILQQTFGADSHDFDMPLGCDFGDSRPFVDGDEDSDWEEDEAEKLLEKMRLNAGHRKSRQDYRTRRDRTQLQWKHWKSQRDPMLDAYLAWSLRENGDAAPESQSVVGEMGIMVIDLFGEFIAHCKA